MTTGVPCSGHGHCSGNGVCTCTPEFTRGVAVDVMVCVYSCGQLPSGCSPAAGDCAIRVPPSPHKNFFTTAPGIVVIVACVIALILVGQIVYVRRQLAHGGRGMRGVDSSRFLLVTAEEHRDEANSGRSRRK